MANVARRKRNMTPKEITALLHGKGYTQERLAKELDRGRSTVSEVVSGLTKSAYIASAIGRVLGLAPSVIWPKIYAPAPDPSAAPLPVSHPLAS
jgi:lambda repressor-like predicted transcriptional regulator